MYKQLFLSLLFLCCFQLQSYEDFEYDDEISSIFCKQVAEDAGEPAPMANLEGEPSAYVHNHVNVISGQFCEFQTDLVVHHGTDPIKLERAFAGSTRTNCSTLGCGWSHNHHSILYFRTATRTSDKAQLQHCLFGDDHGGPLVVLEMTPTISDSSEHRFPLRKDVISKGITNTSRGWLSGQTNFCNLKASVKHDNTTWLIFGDNTTREYTLSKRHKAGQYRISQELKPKGNKFVYSYKSADHDDHISRIELQNQSNSVNGFMDFDIHTKKTLRKEKPYTVTTNDGRWVTYNFEKLKSRDILLRSVEFCDQPKTEYYYTYFYHTNSWGISSKTLPEKRSLEISYYNQYNNAVMAELLNFHDRKDPRIGRVKALYAPVGTGPELYPIYQFHYDLSVEIINGTNKNQPSTRIVKHGSCDVFNALGYKTQYAFDADHRLTVVNKFHANGQLYTREELYWAPNESPHKTCLVTRRLFEDNTNIFARTYQYDQFGNVQLDSLYGNLSGKNTNPLLLLQDGTVVQNECEVYIQGKVYSQDGLNLLLIETDGILSTHYFYQPGTNRLISKYQGAGSKYLRRWFYEYNEDAAPVKEISDDGSQIDQNDLTDVTERRITYYVQSKKYPVAFPLVIEEKCLDLATGQELLIHKVVNTYTNQAKIKQQDHYDDQGVLAYSLFWEYDKMGNNTSETNALGQKTIRRFDANNNCIYEKKGGQSFHTLYTYDFMNRLIKEEEVHPDGNNRIITNRYDVANNKYATTDQNGNETRFVHDPFGRVIETIYPQMLCGDHVSHPTVKKSYDAMSKVTSEINARGIETQMSYNIRGQLTHKTYPDGTIETNTYHLNGLLYESKAKNGTITRFTYDPLSRPTKTEVFSQSGELLSTSTITYQGVHILEETDPSGINTQYTYYPDGKTKSCQRGNLLTTYTYDSLGRRNQEIDHYGSNETDVIINIKDHDILGRITEEKTLDGYDTVLSKVTYTYDDAGNVCLTEKHTDKGASVTEITYDSHGTPVLVIDAEGNKTITEVRYNYLNELGQFVPYKEVTDPKGNVTITISNVFGKVTHNIRKNAYGKITQKQEMSYDINCNLCAIKDVVICPDDTEQEIISIMTYDTSDRLFTCYEAYGTPEQKQTKITYNSCGQKEFLIKNDGVTLEHTYDAMGLLKSLKSSDKTVHYVYRYDLIGNPVRVDDLVHGTATTRRYDDKGFMVEETLANQLVVKYEHDHMGRPTEIIFPDDSKVAFDYRAIFLESIRRFDVKNNLKYQHTYQAYDLSGNLKEMKFIENAGSLKYEHDILGRIKSTITDKWSEKIDAYDEVGNILGISLNDAKGDANAEYTYDDLYQITSESGPASHKYTYDSHYNRHEKDGKKHILNPLHQLLDDGISTYSYDTNGNLREKKSAESISIFSYDALDRLTAFIKDKVKVAYRYDENNRRLSKTFYSKKGNDWEELNTTRFLYQGQNEIGSVDENGNINELRILGVGKGAEIGAAIAMEIGVELYVPIHDHIGNVSCLLNAATGDVVETYRYSSFGEELFDKAISPWRFSSKRTDSETGFVYFGRRYYDAETGRWVTPDPIGREGGPNLYAYVLNRPLTHFDLYGLFGISNSFSEGLSNFFDCISSTISKVASLPGLLVSTVAREIVPLPYVKDVLEFGGWCLQGKNPSQFQWQKDHSQLAVYEGKNGHINPNQRHIMYFGILTSLDECKQRLEDYSQKNGGVTVYGIYNATHGFVLDAMEVACQKLGISTHAQEVAEKETRRILNEMGEFRDSAELFVTAHSQGAETVHNLSYDLRQKTYATTYGGARMLQRKDFAGAYNNIAPLDIVPLLDPIGIIRGYINGNVRYLPSSGNPISDHFYNNEMFTNDRNYRGKFYVENFVGAQ